MNAAQLASVLSAAEIRQRLTESGMRDGANTVRPPKSARRIETSRCLIGPGQHLTGAFLRASLWAGAASDGFKSTYDRRERWWTILTVEDRDGRVQWSLGQRSSSEAKARAEYQASAQSMLEDGLPV